MNEIRFMSEALKTESAPRCGIHLNKKQARLLHAAMGMATEAAEFLDMMKKHIFYGKPFDLVNAIEEMGDSDWYRAIFLDATSVHPDTVRQACINKLRKRYGEKFDAGRAVKRNLKLERKTLEESV